MLCCTFTFVVNNVDYVVCVCFFTLVVKLVCKGLCHMTKNLYQNNFIFPLMIN